MNTGKPFNARDQALKEARRIVEKEEYEGALAEELKKQRADSFILRGLGSRLAGKKGRRYGRKTTKY